MPRISREKYYFDGEEIYKTINVNSKGVFSMTLPAKVVDLLALHTDKVMHDTKDGVEKIWKEYLQEYKDAKTVERKVILFEIEANCSFKVDDEWFQKDDISFSKGLTLSIQAGVYTEVVVTRAADKHYLYRAIKSEIPQDVLPPHKNVNYGGRETKYHVIDWTEQREEFFTQLGLSLQNMIWNINSFMSSPEITNMIDQGGLLLLPRAARIDSKATQHNIR